MMRSRPIFQGIVALAGLAGLAAFAPRASAEDVAAFYAGRTINLYIGYSIGGAYDVYARQIARTLGKHIPGNPTVVPQNMEGAGSLRAANYIYTRAPKDGTAIATFGRGIAFYPLMGMSGATFDATKLNWLGSANNETSLCVAWAATGITSIDDLKTREMTAGGTGPSDDTVQFVKVINAALGTRMRTVTGYPGGGDVLLAMERGEVEGRCGWSYSSLLSTRKSWIADHKVNILLQLGLRKHPELPDVPLAVDLPMAPDRLAILRLVFARQVMGRPFVAPPGVPPERLAALREAFMATMKDPEFLADAEQAQLEIDPVDGAEVQKLVTDTYRTPPDLALEAGKMMN
ncbi:MAG: tripartite tricarboxylate transporter family receptor [Rhodospirillales bacterium]|jgi:tripartite-type tricarboxylate transporter receptor subunit TctC|nr:tripartite tricarboxylate transporter family receptor [Rhodospirillales bacterium]